MATTHVNYKLIDKNNKILEEHNNAACYSSITYNALPTSTVKIVCHHSKSNTPYTEDECKQWIDEVNKFGFPCEYVGFGTGIYNTPKDHHVIVIPIKNDEQVFYSQKTYLTSALMMVRYLMEAGLFDLPKEYFKLLKILPKDIDRFKLMQFAHTKIIGNSNHSIRDFQLRSLISKQEFEERANKLNYSIYNRAYTSISSLWIGNQIGRTEVDDAKMFLKLTNHTIKVYVVGDPEYANWLPNTKVVKTFESADLILFTGGEDVDPSMYNEPHGHNTQSNLERDIYEKKLFDKALKAGKKMLGICRGSQFLCVMSGGKLVQDQKNPAKVHEMTVVGQKIINISSTHHQAQYPFNLPFTDYKILGWTKGISNYHLDGNGKELNPELECEIVQYNKTKCLGIQGHPEFKSYQREYPESLEVLKEIYNKFILQ